jgi:glycerol-3-phosphate cytidylyltransferase
MILLTIGTFDGLHVGHLELLSECRRLIPDGSLYVGVNSDEFVERYKGHAPRQPLAHRIELLRSLRSVDGVFANIGAEDSGVLIDAIRPDMLAIGDDWLDPGHDQRRYLAQLGVTLDWLHERGLLIQYIPRTRGVSSTALRGAA